MYHNIMETVVKQAGQCLKIRLQLSHHPLWLRNGTQHFILTRALEHEYIHIHVHDRGIQFQGKLKGLLGTNRTNIVH